MSRYDRFDRSCLALRPIGERGHDLNVADCLGLQPPQPAYSHPEFRQLVDAVSLARQQRRPVILFLGAHPVKLGLSRYVIDLMERRFVTHVATNGAGLIHDFELSAVGGTSENVARWIVAGQFGLWQETARFNDIARQAAERDEGLGEAVGRTIVEQRFPHRDVSIAAAGWRLGVPITCHVSIGQDIVHSHPNCDGAAFGRTSLTDFLILARAVEDLEGGVFLNVGSAVAGPEVYLKALSMARNVAHQEGREIRRFTTAVFDLLPLPVDFRQAAPPREDPRYYYRPWKTILVRTVADGGHSFYFCGGHLQTIPSLWHELVRGRSGEDPRE